MVWRMLGRTKLTAAADSITVSFTADTHLKVIASIIGAGSNNVLEPQWRLGYNSIDATSGNYTTARSNDGTESTHTSSQTMTKSNASGQYRNSIKYLDIINVANKEKLVSEDDATSQATGNTSSNCRAAESNWKWTNTSNQANMIQLVNNGSAGDHFLTGSEVVVFGTEVASTASAAVYPLIPNGAIFEESDTGKHYMFDGTDTWNEMPLYG